MSEPREVYIVNAPAWDGEFDSVWATEEEAQDRADALDPYPDADGVRWGIVSRVQVGADPDGDGYMALVERRKV